MNHRSSRLTTLVAGTIAVLAAVTLTACGSSNGSGSSGTTSGAASTGSSGVDHAKSEVESHLAALSSFKAPGGPISGLDALKGGTITYVPITLQATFFQAQYEQISQAAAPLGIKVQSCDAKSQPTVATQCINQAVAAKSIGIITDSIPFALAQNAFDAAAAANIPILASDANEPVPASLTGKVVTSTTGQDVGGRLMADAIIADSGGSAHVLFVNSTSNNSAKQVSAAVQDEFKAYCPGCVVSTATWEPTSVQKIPTAVSVGLNADPKINYVYTRYDTPAGPLVLQGMQLSKQGSSLKLVGYGADPAALQRIKNGTQLADVATDSGLGAWNNTDRLLRTVTKTPVPAESAYTLPRRIFNSTNVSSVGDLTVDAFKSGAWFSDGQFRSTYKQVWGVS